MAQEESASSTSSSPAPLSTFDLHKRARTSAASLRSLVHRLSEGDAVDKQLLLSTREDFLAFRNPEGDEMRNGMAAAYTCFVEEGGMDAIISLILPSDKHG